MIANRNENTHKPAVLIIDDEVDIISTLTLFLEDEGFNVFSVNSAQAGIILLRNNS